VISRDGIVIRTRMDSIRPMGRATQGVAVINVAPGDAVAALATIDMDANGNGNGGPKGKSGGPDAGTPEGEQQPLAGIDAAPAERARKPTPIKGRTRAERQAAAAPAPQPRTKAPPRASKPAPAAHPARPAPARTAVRGPKSARLKKGRPRR
jgi:hypothetical protein